MNNDEGSMVWEKINYLQHWNEQEQRVLYFVTKSNSSINSDEVTLL